MDVPELFHQASDRWVALVRAVRDDQWEDPTPCADWDVWTLVNHVIGEELWVPELLAGRTIAEVGDKYEGDVLGADPGATAEAASEAAKQAVSADGAMEVTTHLSFGDFPGEQYALQVFADLFIHGWDLATATSTDTKLDPEQVQAAMAWFEAVEDDYRAAGAIGPRPAVPADADPQTVLLAMFGRTG